MQSTLVRSCGATVCRIALALASVVFFSAAASPARACPIPNELTLALEGDVVLTITTDPSTEAPLSEIGVGTIGAWFTYLLFPKSAGDDVPVNLYGLGQIAGATERAVLARRPLVFYFLACQDADTGVYVARSATLTSSPDQSRAQAGTIASMEVDPSLSFGSTLPLDGLEASTVLRGSLAAE